MLYRNLLRHQWKEFIRNLSEGNKKKWGLLQP